VLYEPTNIAYAPVRKLWVGAITLVLITGCFAVFVALFLAKNLSNPIEKLIAGIEIVASGNLDYQVKSVSNDELGKLKSALDAMPGMLLKGGRIVVLSYHSLEDRIAKQSFRKTQEEGLMEILTKKVLCARDEEQKLNPRSRSAKLRCSERI